MTPVRLERNISKTAGDSDSVPKDYQYFRSSTQQTTVRPERCGATDFLGKEVRPHNSTAP